MGVPYGASVTCICTQMRTNYYLLTKLICLNQFKFVIL